MTQPADQPKDYDEVLRGLPWPERRAAAKRYVAGAAAYPVWKIRTTLNGGSAAKSGMERLELARGEGLFKLAADAKGAEREAMVQDLTFALGIDMGAVEEEVRKAAGDDLAERFADIMDTASEIAGGGGFKPGPKLWRRWAEEMWDWFGERGGRFFFDRANHKPFLFYGDETHDLSVGDVVLMGRLWKLAGLNAEDRETKWILAELRARAAAEGARVDEHSWIHTNKAERTVYLNMAAADGTILKLSPGKIETLENGVNDDAVLLRRPHFMKPFTYVSDMTGDVETLEAFGRLVYGNVASSREDALFTAVWGLAPFLTGFTSLRPIVHFQGAQGSGKTGASKLLWALMYGSEEFLGRSTLAALRTSGSQAPYIVKDDLGARDMNESLSQFLKVSATGLGSTRRASGSDHGVITESSSSLIALTGILPFDAPDLRERIYTVVCSRRWQNPGFVEGGAMTEILQRRDAILSAVFRVIAYGVLPRIHEEQAAMVKWLKERFPNWAKARMDEFYALYIMLARRLAEPMGRMPESYEGTADEFLFGRGSAAVLQELGFPACVKGEEGEVARFIKAQDELSREFDVESSATLFWLRRLFDHLGRQLESKEPGERTRCAETGLVATLAREDDEAGQAWRAVVIEASTGDVFSALATLAKMIGRQGALPFTSPLSLAKMISNEERLLAGDRIHWQGAVTKNGAGTRINRYTRLVEPMGRGEQEGMW